MNEQDLPEYIAFLKSQNKTPEEIGQYLRKAGFAPPSEATPVSQQSGVGRVPADFMTADSDKNVSFSDIKEVLRTLDLTSGLSRLGIGKGVESATGKDLQLPGWREVLGLQADVPMTEEMMAKADVLADSPLTRKAIGFVGDVALDPVTLLTLGGAGAAKAGLSKVAKGAAQAAKVADYANPLGKALGKYVVQPGMTSFYKSGLKNIDSRLIQEGLEPIAPILLKEGARGGNKQIEKGIQESIDKRMDMRDQLYNEVKNAGVTVDRRTIQEPALNYLAEQRKIWGRPLDEDQAMREFIESSTISPEAEVIKAQYQKELSDYNIKKAMFEKEGFGQQNLAPYSDPYVTTTKQIEVPLSGPEAVMSPQVVEQLPFQFALEPIPTKRVNVKGGRSTMTKEDPRKLAKNIEAQIPEVGWDQLAIQGTEINPYSKSAAEILGVKQVGPEQLSFNTNVPSGPPVAPVMPDLPGIDVFTASKRKTELGKKLPQRVYDAFGKPVGEWDQILNRLRQGHQKGVIEAGERARPGLGAQIDVINKDLNPLISSQELIANEIAKGERKNLISQTKAGVAGALRGDISAVTGMYGAELLNNPWFRTHAGYLGNRFGDSPAADALWRQILLAPTNQGEE